MGELAAGTIHAARRCAPALVAAVLLASGCRSRQEVVPGERSPTRRQLYGSFTVDTGRLVVSDPCYGRPRAGEPDDLQGSVTNALPGEWRAFVVEAEPSGWGRRCAELIAHHTAYPIESGVAWLPARSSIGVDSAQAGIFEWKTMDDDAVVPPGWFGAEGPIAPDQLWYSMCCKQTAEGVVAGIVPGGVVSQSGLGDGLYRWFTRLDPHGAVVGVRVVFLTEEEWK